MRKSIYSFIHTKPISSRNYVLGKYIAGISMVLLFVVILTAIVDVVAVSAGNSYGYKTSLWDIWANIIMYDLPGILLTGCIMLFISILFKNVIPAIPAMLFVFHLRQHRYAEFRRGLPLSGKARSNIYTLSSAFY